jgi:hypothetical protein
MMEFSPGLILICRAAGFRFQARVFDRASGVESMFISAREPGLTPITLI